MQERLAIAGSGTIATGLAAVAAARGDVVLWARSDAAAERAERSIARHRERDPGLTRGDRQVRVLTELEALADATFLVEAVLEDRGCKAPLLARLSAMTGPEQIVATTTSSLSVAGLALDSGHPERFVALHVFNPVPRMELVELSYDAATRDDVRERTRALCLALGKTPVEVPDSPGFVVNRLLFGYLFDAVGFLAESGMAPVDVDRCMALGAAMPMGPIALLDFIGLDVAVAIGEAIDAEIPPRLRELVGEGALGRKSGRGFYTYE